MAKSSIRFEKAGQHLAKHNFREDKPSYLLPKEFQKENFVWKSEISAREFFKQEQDKIQNRRGARKASFENSHWEAVLNLNGDHGLTDCQAVAELVEKKFNIKCHSIAIHHDEGHLIQKSTGEHLSPGIDYYTDKNGKSFFINEQGEKTKEPLNISDFEPVYNYHAHLEFSTYKDQKQNWRKSLTQPKLRELQSEVAEILQMQRGKENSKTQHKTHQQHKAEQHAIEQEKTKKREIEKELFNTKEALEALRKESKNQGFTAEYFRELNKAKKELTFKDQEAFNEWKQDLIERHTKKGIFGKKTDTEAVLTEQFEKIEQLNAINQATEQSKNAEIEAEKERLKKENEKVLADLQTQELERLNAEYEAKEKKLKADYAKSKENTESFYADKFKTEKAEFLATQRSKENALISKELTLESKERKLNEREQELNQDSFIKSLKEKIEFERKAKERAEAELQRLKNLFGKAWKYLKSKISTLTSDLKAERQKNDKLQALNTQNTLNAKETPLNDKEKEQQEIENGEYLYFKERENRKSGESKYIFFTKTQHKNYVANNFDDTRKLSELFSFEKNEVLSALDLHKTLVKFARARKTEQNKEPKKDLNKNRGGLER